MLNTEELSSEEMLREYKAQQSCERGFRFLKDPLFLADSVFLKTPQRIETMGKKEYLINKNYLRDA